MAVTFNPHPVKVLRPESEFAAATTRDQKLQRSSESGLDAVVVLPFTQEFAALPAREFVKQYFCDRLKAREVVVGHDYCFGRGREGNIDLLKEMGEIKRLHRAGGLGRGSRRRSGEQLPDPGLAAPGKSDGGPGAS